MSIIQVSRIGNRFAVLEDNSVIPGSYSDTRGDAIKFALEYRNSK